MWQQGFQEADVQFWELEERGKLQRCCGASGEGNQATEGAGAEGEPGRHRHGPGTDHYWPPSHQGGLRQYALCWSCWKLFLWTMFALHRSHFVVVCMFLNQIREGWLWLLWNWRASEDKTQQVAWWCSHHLTKPPTAAPEPPSLCMRV